MPVGARDSEDIYLKIRGGASTIEGTFGVKVEKLQKATAQEIPVGGEEVTVSVNAGDMKLLYFNGQQNQANDLSSLATIKSVCCGDGILMHISAYREDGSTSYFYQRDIALKNFNQPGIDQLTAWATEKVYVIVDGSYWFLPNAVVLSVVPH